MINVMKLIMDYYRKPAESPPATPPVPQLSLPDVNWDAVREVIDALISAIKVIETAFGSKDKIETR